MKRLLIIRKINDKMFRNKGKIKRLAIKYAEETDGRKVKGIISKIDKLKEENNELEKHLNKLNKIKGNENIPFKNNLTFIQNLKNI